MNLKATGREKARELPEIKFNLIDRFVDYLSPVRGTERFKSRMIRAMAGAYFGASKKRRSLSQWITSGGDADTDIIGELPVLRERSRDLVRNNPLATGAINTKATSIVGTGLKLKARIDYTTLGLSEDDADAWEKKTEAEWRMFSESADIDIARNSNFAALQDLSLRSTLENGDVFSLTPMKKLPHRAYALRLQLIEADRVCNADNVGDTETLSGGVQKDEFGCPVEYHILKGHPGNIYSKNTEWEKVPAFGQATGRRNVIHLYNKKRIGQSRGVPDLAPVIELLKQLSRYTESELMATVIGSFFTVFIKTEGGHSLAPMQPTDDIGGKSSDKDYKMGSGAILDLAPGESIETANPGRPNQAFDAFVVSICRQIGAGLELPFEILVKHFTSSYSAARAAMLEAWRFFMARRKWMADNFCQPVYELFLAEAVSRGRIHAPGFLDGDPLIRAAYLRAEWIGPARGQIDEKKEVEAAQKRVDMGVSTLDRETAEITGNDWEAIHPQRAKEHKRRLKDGLIQAEKPESRVIEPDEKEEGEEDET